ncbi:MAG: glycosyltransferase family 39 protein [Flavobacteriales bacterium]
MLPALEERRSWGFPLHAIVLAVLAGIFLWNASLRWHMLFQHRTELGGVEHNVIHGIQKVMLGHDLYEDPERPPFDVMQYTPAYYLLCAAIGKILGLHGEDVRSIYLLSRTMALLFNVVMVWFVYRTCRVAGAALWASWIAAGVSFACLWEHFFTRMDAMAAALAAASVYHSIQWIIDRKHRSLVLVTVLSVLGVLAKQSGVVMLAAPFVFLLLNKEWRALKVFILSSGIALVLCTMVVLQLGTVHAFYQNTVLGLRNGISLQMYAELFNPPTYKYFIGWHIMAAVVVVKGLKSRSGTLRYLALCIPMSLGFALITGLKYGSRLNYIHESLMLTFIGVAVLLPHMEQVRSRNVLAWSFAGYGLLFAAFRTNSVLAWFRVGEPDTIHAQHMEHDKAVHAVLLGELGLKPEEYVFITYREYLEHYLVGRSLLTQKDIVQYSKDRLFDYSAFHRAMTDGTVRFVITDGATGPVTYLDSTYAGWEPIRAVQGRMILARVPRP